MLEYFARIKQAEIAALQRDEATLHNKVRTSARPSLQAALAAKVTGQSPAFIAEYKRASPALGSINLTAEPGPTAQAYARGGAAAISVLTEATRFEGKLEYIEAIHSALDGSLPLLRKDFILHPLQVTATAGTAAAALLLIVELSPQARLLRDLRELAQSYGMEAIVEVFSAKSLDIARESGARLIQVNARNLQTMRVDREHALGIARAQRHKGSSPELWIAASGISQPAHVCEAREAGFEAVLVGTSLMQGGDPQAALAKLSTVQEVLA